MTVKKRPSGLWEARVRKNGVYLGSQSFALKKEAEAWERELLAQHAEGIDVRQASRRVGEFLPVFLEHRALYSNVTEATRTTDEHMFKRLPDWFLALKVGKVVTPHVEKVLFDDARAHERKHGSIVRCRTSLSAFFTFLMKRGVISKNPARQAAIPQTAPMSEKFPWMGPEIVERYVKWKEHDEQYAKIAFIIYFLALRWGEARALEVGDVHLEGAPRVLVQRSQSEGKDVAKSTKTGKPRWVPVADILVPFLTEFTHGRMKDERLFLNMTRTRFRYRLQWKETGQGKTIHQLRHEGITAWVEAGVQVALVQRWAGHARIETTMGYVHLVGDRVNEAGIAQVNSRNLELMRAA